MEKRKIEINKIDRAAVFMPETVNEKNRTVEIVFSTGSRVMRRPFFDEPFIEELSLDKKHVRLDRLNMGAPFLNNHNSFELSDVLGVVETASVDGEQGTATVRFSSRDDVEPIFQDVKNGILRNISVGYRVHKFEETEASEENATRILRATDWEPMEISLVGIPADAGAQVRKQDNELNHCEIKLFSDKGETKMEIEEKREVAVETAPAKVETIVETKIEKVIDQDAIESARKDETKRIMEITAACRAGKMENSEVEKFIVDGKSADEVRQLVIETMAKKDEKPMSQKIEIQNDENKTRNEGLENALLNRANSENELSENGKRFRNYSLIEMAAATIGKEVRDLGKNEIAKRAFHATSDFPILLENVCNKSMRRAYGEFAPTYQPFTREVSVSDFKEVARVQMGEFEALKKVEEGEKYDRGTVGEAKEKYKICTFGRMFAITRQALINDDLSAFDRIPSLMAKKARDLESDLVWEILTSNPLMGDGVNLFDAAHGNIATSFLTAPDIDSAGEGRSKMRLQTGLDGNKINLRPSWIYVPVALESKVEQLVSSIVPANIASTNPFGPGGRSSLRIGVEPRLDDDSATAWYLMADLGQIDMIELARLNGQGPVIESRQGFECDGLEMKIRFDVGAAAIDHRGFYRNAGV